MINRQINQLIQKIKTNVRDKLKKLKLRTEKQELRKFVIIVIKLGFGV